ncbi:MAG TPA: DNA mismatch repair protein MutS [Thermoplasmata archaeon]|nr:DNA mismatch repair protein MutS [Thermoplasmata archaeon]
MSDATPSTPLLEQYEGVKARYPGHLVLFRVGDFFETFGDDARLLSKELDVVLTARAPDARGDRTPMAGVPHHAVETYLARLVRKGYKVALCDQVEDARFAKGLVRREVTRVVTPGTVVEDGILGGPDHNFLACVVGRGEGPGAFAAVDITTGEWFHGLADGAGPDGLLGALAPFRPREVLWEEAAGPSEDALLSALRRELPGARVEHAPAPLTAADWPVSLELPLDTPEVVAEADHRLGAFLRATQPRILPFLTVVTRGRGDRRLVLDAKTLRHLEILRPMNPDDPKGPTLLDAVDETRTAPGRRTLAFWLANPLADLDGIVERQEAVDALAARGAALEPVRDALRPIADLARIASRIVGRRTRPPELGAARASLRAVARVRQLLGDGARPGRLATVERDLEAPEALVALLERAVPETPPASLDGGELFRPGFVPVVDAARDRERTAVAALTELERTEQERTGIRTLKIGYNQVFGYYLEITRPHLARVPPEYRRRQTVAQAERFGSDRLEALEREVLGAREEARAAELEAWERFLVEVDGHVPAMHRIARAVGELDVLATFAHLAQSRGFVRPTVDGSTALVIRDGRHPVLAPSLGARFVPNDTELDGDALRLLVLTGPNMSGKSTYMRQIGLLVVLAQVGCGVPAKFARIGLVTQLFTRMGFTDEIGRGKSSFMVEMTEVAEILRAADARSLVLLDEVGRGTSTFDGLAIAWATLRHLHDTTRARCVLATHYHQLTELVGGLPAAQNAHLAVREGPDGIVFLHRLVPGSTDRSYGIHVARLAGLPEDVLAEADRLLRRLEADGVALPGAGRAAARRARYTQAVLVTGLPEADDPLRRALDAIDLDRLTPEEALAILKGLAHRPGVPKAGDGAAR